ncbi:7515_t:CDS:1, partial [Paraglomus occultum]
LPQLRISSILDQVTRFGTETGPKLEHNKNKFRVDTDALKNNLL